MEENQTKLVQSVLHDFSDKLMAAAISESSAFYSLKEELLKTEVVSEIRVKATSENGVEKTCDTVFFPSEGSLGIVEGTRRHKIELKREPM